MAMRKSQRSLAKWSKQKWDYISKGQSKKPRSKRGRYLPESIRKKLTPSQKAYENRKVRAARKKGKKVAKYSKRVRKMVGRL
tara:strand:+ start:691 stop:936 length:246 start_codon:yes stop_codon:yes gene_type:complete